ncbi:MAG: hypothetical protein FWE71_15325 [Nocardioidaceae bacterium]|nr:hypothetical protein [Nocardioidaceae bacterium]MCL2614552.1 hypothetical protein [Nocardioidaceae bacterium]
MRRLIGLALCALLSVTVPALSVAPAARAASGSGTCRVEHNSVMECVKVIKHLSTQFHQTGSDGEDNRTPQRHTLTCSIKKTSSFAWGMSSSISAEGSAWIFAKVSVKIGAHFDKTEATENGVSTKMPVPPHTTVHCLRGTEVQTWKIRVCLSNVSNQSCSYGKWHAPQGLIWRTTEHHD